MPISKKHKLIFIHVPRTGGTSIVNSLGLRRQSHTGSKILLNKKEEFEDYLSFAVCRNPYDWVVSVYFHFLNDKKHSNYDRKLVNEYNFQDTIKILKEERYRLKHPFWNGQAQYVCVMQDNILVDKLLRFENLEKEFYDLTHLHLNHLNGSEREKDWRIYYDDKTLEHINKIYSQDFRIFGYKV